MAKERPSLNLSGAGKADRSKSPKTRGETKKVASTERKKAESMSSKRTRSLTDVPEEDDEDDDELLDEAEAQGKSHNLLFVVLGVCLVVIVCVAFLLLRGRRTQEPVDEPTPPPVEEPTVTPTENPVYTPPEGVGTQDFTGDTNMQTSNVLTNPENFVKDLYGLTTRVDYTVSAINYIADFVSYTKQRGTWGEGLELYWLDATYKNRHYVIQVPFKYYKELDDVGIVPVKMECLTIQGSANGELLSVISYMELDEETLYSVLSSQTK